LYKDEVDSGRKTELRELVEAYMGEAEELKKKIKIEHEGKPSKKSVFSFGSLFGKEKTEKTVKSPPVSHPDSYDYTAEARLKRNKEMKEKGRLSGDGSEAKSSSYQSSGSDINRRVSAASAGSGQKKGPFSPDSNLKLVSPPSSSSAEKSKDINPPKNAPKSGNITKELTEYEKQIMSEMLDATPGVRWIDVAGLAYAKQVWFTVSFEVRVIVGVRVSLT
jgi:hypothetical protein